MKSEISRKLIKQFLVNRQTDSEFKPIVPVKPGDESYPQNMVRLINFGADSMATATPATNLMFYEKGKRKHSDIKKKSKERHKSNYKNFINYSS